jgi:lipid-binding SYLF domain-containing protein
VKQIILAIFVSTILFVLSGTAAHSGWDPNKTETATNQNIQDPEVAQAIADFKNSDPSMETFFKKAYGFAIFPTVSKGGAGIGGAYGKGKVYGQGILEGTSSLTQFTLGLQLGGQIYREIIFFENKTALDLFKYGNFEFGAQASAVAATAGVSADTDYSSGVAIFTLAKGGLMFEASVGGQKFTFEPLN